MSHKTVFNFGHSYVCLECNQRSDYEDLPQEIMCQHCHSEDVYWLPPKYKTPSHVDQTLRRIADRYKLSDMGQRGGTRAGENVRKSVIQEAPERFVNVNGINVPVTNGVHSSWATTTTKASVKLDGGKPYAGMAAAKSIPTKVVHEHRG